MSGPGFITAGTAGAVLNARRTGEVLVLGNSSEQTLVDPNGSFVPATVAKVTIPANTVVLLDRIRITGQFHAVSPINAQLNMQVTMGSVQVAPDAFNMIGTEDASIYAMSVQCRVNTGGASAVLNVQPSLTWRGPPDPQVYPGLGDQALGGVDLTVENDVTLDFKFASSHAGNTVTVNNLLVEILRA